MVLKLLTCRYFFVHKWHTYTQGKKMAGYPQNDARLSSLFFLWVIHNLFFFVGKLFETF